MSTIPTLILMSPRTRRAWMNFLGILNVILFAWCIARVHNATAAANNQLGLQLHEQVSRWRATIHGDAKQESQLVPPVEFRISFGYLLAPNVVKYTL